MFKKSPIKITSELFLISLIFGLDLNESVTFSLIWLETKLTALPPFNNSVFKPTQESIKSYHAIHRCIKYAFEYTKNNNRKKITLCAKTNVLTFAHDLWERIFYDVAKDYPDIETDYGHVDAICMWMVKNPEWFDVIVTDNMFGDIITDLGAMIQGGMGIAAGGNINPLGTSMFEPIGGSAPKYTGKNIINPLACIGAGAMMVKELGEEKYASDIEKAIINTAIKLDSLSAGKMGMSTEEVGDSVVEELSNLNE